MDSDTTLTRYISYKTCIEILTKNFIFMPVALAYEVSDINEGRFTDEFVQRMKEIHAFIQKKSAVKGVKTSKEYKENLERISEDFDLEIDVNLARMMSTRENTYVSCWTYNEQEDARLWRSFADEGSGVAIRSTIRRVSTAMENLYVPYGHRPPTEELHLYEGEIIYQRENIHEWLAEGNYEDHSHMPLFFIDGGFLEHEKEYRFIAIDSEEVSEVASEKLGGKISHVGNYKQALSYRLKKTKRRPKGLSVDIEVNQMITEIVFGPKMPASFAARIEKLKKKHGFSFKISRSSLQLE